MPAKRLAFLVQSIAITVFAAGTLVAQGSAAQQVPAEEVHKILSDLIAINTSNPPGNEVRAAKYIQEVMQKEGIEAQVYESQPGRGNLIARLKGSGKHKPVLLLAHLDTVGVQLEHWLTDPFKATVKDGYIYGRGAMDDKGMLTANLIAFLELHRRHVPLDRDVIFAAEAGEEGDPAVGIDYLIEKHWPEIDAEVCLNEGGGMVVENGKVRYVAVSTTEKVPWPTKLVAHGRGGHASVPTDDDAVTHLAAAVAKIGAFQMPARIDQNALLFFNGLARISPPQEAEVYGKLADPVHGEEAQAKLKVLNPRYAATLRTTVVPTMMNAGFRTNVVPSQAEATLDIRVLPSDDIKDVVARLKTVINDPAVDVIPPTTSRPAGSASSTDTDLFRGMEAAQKQLFPGTATLPMLLPATTDGAELRAKGMLVYGLGGPQTSGDRERVHGDNERIGVTAIEQFSQFVYLALVHTVS